MENQNKNLTISWGVLIKVAVAFLCFYLIYLLKDIILLFIFALIISVLFDPAINFLRKLKIPRILGVIFVYLSFFGILGMIIYSIAPMFISEVQQFTQLFPQYFERMAPILRGLGFEAFENIEVFTQSIGSTLQGASSNIFTALAAIFGGLGSTLFILSIAPFLSFGEKSIEKAIGFFVPKKYENYVFSLWNKSQNKISSWFATRLLGCLFIGLAMFITFKLFNIKYALSLALLGGILDFIPVIGPIFTAILTFAFIALDSWSKAIFALIALGLLQQIENIVLIPLLSKKYLGIPSVVVLLSLTIGATLAGIPGAILATPLAGIVYEFLGDFLKKRKKDQEGYIDSPPEKNNQVKTVIW